MDPYVLHFGQEEENSIAPPVEILVVKAGKVFPHSHHLPLHSTHVKDDHDDDDDDVRAVSKSLTQHLPFSDMTSS